MPVLVKKPNQFVKVFAKNMPTLFINTKYI